MGFFKALHKPLTLQNLPPSVLVCQVVVTSEGFDSLAAPDLRVTLRLGQHPSVTRDGHEESHVMYLSVPGVTLRTGDLLAVSVADRDVFEVEMIGSGQGRFEGSFPVRMESRHTSTECRAMLTHQVEAQVPAYLNRVIQRLNELERAGHPRPFEADWGYPHWAIDLLHISLVDLAALVGWADVRMQGQLKRLDTFHADWEEAATASVSRLAEKQPPSGRPVLLAGGRMQVQLLQADCGPRQAGFCRVEGELTLQKGKPLHIDLQAPQEGATGLPEAIVVRQDGRTHALSVRKMLLKERPVQQATLQPGEKVKVVWQGQDPLRTRPAALLWLRSPGHNDLLRLE